MTVVTLSEIVFSHSEMAENGQIRLRQAVDAGGKANLSIPIQGQRVRFIYQWRIGDIPANVFYLNFMNVRNWNGNRVLLGTEQLNHPTNPFPFLIVKGSDGVIAIENTDVAERTFEITLDYFDIPYMLIEQLEKYINWKFEL